MYQIARKLIRFPVNQRFNLTFQGFFHYPISRGFPVQFATRTILKRFIVLEIKR
jgi:hypothetical protein